MSSAKAALESDTRTLAYEAGRRWGARVNAISAGPWASRAASAIGFIEKMIDYGKKNSPLPEAIDADEVGATAAFLCSPARERHHRHDGLRRQGLPRDGRRRRRRAGPIRSDERRRRARPSCSPAAAASARSRSACSQALVEAGVRAGLRGRLVGRRAERRVLRGPARRRGRARAARDLGGPARARRVPVLAARRPARRARAARPHRRPRPARGACSRSTCPTACSRTPRCRVHVVADERAEGPRGRALARPGRPRGARERGDPGRLPAGAHRRRVPVRRRHREQHADRGGARARRRAHRRAADRLLVRDAAPARRARSPWRCTA